MRKNPVSLEDVVRAARFAVVGSALAATGLVLAAIVAGLPLLAVLAATALVLLALSWAS